MRAPRTLEEKGKEDYPLLHSTNLALPPNVSALSCAALRRRCPLTLDGVAETYHGRLRASSAVSAAAPCWAADDHETIGSEEQPW